jgi:hypothetical protein
MRSIAESTWTKEQALAFAVQYLDAKGRWPARRFRIERSRAGNSRLLNRESAERDAARYGGDAVELIPTLAASGVLRPTAHEQAAEGLPECSKCQAEADAACVNPKGRQRTVHRERVDDKGECRAWAIAHVTCRQCSAAPGVQCLDAKSKPCAPHVIRLLNALRRTVGQQAVPVSVAQMVRCLECGVGPGPKCVNGNGMECPPHASRIRAAQEAMKAKSPVVNVEQFTTCLKCHAGPGGRCVDGKGKSRKAHAERVRTAKSAFILEAANQCE